MKCYQCKKPIRFWHKTSDFESIGISSDRLKFHEECKHQYLRRF